MVAWGDVRANEEIYYRETPIYFNGLNYTVRNGAPVVGPSMGFTMPFYGTLALDVQIYIWCQGISQTWTDLIASPGVTNWWGCSLVRSSGALNINGRVLAIWKNLGQNQGVNAQIRVNTARDDTGWGDITGAWRAMRT